MDFSPHLMRKRSYCLCIITWYEVFSDLFCFHAIPLKTNFKYCNMHILLISSSFLLFCIHTFIPCSSSEFFIDGIGKLLVVSCKHLSIGHQTHEEQKEYDPYRNQRIEEEKIKLAHHYFKNYLKCIKYWKTFVLLFVWFSFMICVFTFSVQGAARFSFVL